jgi:hypothetical protein
MSLYGMVPLVEDCHWAALGDDPAVPSARRYCLRSNTSMSFLRCSAVLPGAQSRMSVFVTGRRRRAASERVEQLLLRP